MLHQKVLAEDPAIRLLFTRVDPFTFRPGWLCCMVNAIIVGTIHTEERRPISQPLIRRHRNLTRTVLVGAVQRLRPKVMTVSVMLLGLAPIMWSSGAGADVMKRIAAPMTGGIFTSVILELVVYPAIFASWKWHAEVKPGLGANVSPP